MKWTIFGGAGYVGNELAKLLLNTGNEVLCVDNFYKGHADNLFNIVSDPNFTFMKGDVRNLDDCKKAVKNADIIVNLAAIVGVPACNNDPYNVFEVNSLGPAKILYATEGTKAKVFIQASTDSVFGSVDVKCNEETTPNPQSTYGESKLKAEKIIKDNVSNINKIILRFSTGMGPSGNMRVNLLVNDLVFTAIEQKNLTIFEPDVLRTFINVKDMARAIYHFGELGIRDENDHYLYCVGDDELNFSKRTLVEAIQKQLSVAVTYIDGSDPDKRNYQVDHSRLRETGFKTQYFMHDTIESLIKTHGILRNQKKYQ